MVERKNNFTYFCGDQPKGTSARPVRSERGIKGLPPDKKGGENMTPDHFEEHKRHTFDSYCKKVLKYEAGNGHRALNRMQSREVSFSSFTEETMEQFATYDRYPWEYTAFPVGGDVILIEDDRLADALNALPQEHRDIFLMYWFLDMADREIADKLNMARRTVNRRRQKAYRLLKELMGGEANG